MTPTYAGPDRDVYVCRSIDATSTVSFHIALVPFVHDLVACCGAPVVDTRPSQVGVALSVVVCTECRARCVAACGGDLWPLLTDIALRH